MARLDEYIFGYRTCKVAPEDSKKLVNVLLRLGICSTVTHSGEFTVREKDSKKFTAYARSRVRFTISRPLGLYGFLEERKERYGVFLALFFLILTFALSARLVWDVRIEGNELLSEYAVESALTDAGFRVGASWSRIDKKRIEASVLSANPEIAWISLSRRGTVAYVRIIESENVGISESPAPLYSNIVADRDGVIEEITVSCGEAVVKVGDVVREGDILISGVVDNGSGVYFCRASGQVRAQAVSEIRANAPRDITEKVPLRHRIAQVRVVLFNFSINIFKNYGNCENTCDIIEETREFALFDRYKLPITLRKAYVIEYSDVERTRTDAEMIEAAKRELDARIYASFRNADVIKLKTGGELTDGSYEMWTRVVYVTDICKESAIEIT